MTPPRRPPPPPQLRDRGDRARPATPAGRVALLLLALGLLGPGVAQASGPQEPRGGFPRREGPPIAQGRAFRVIGHHGSGADVDAALAVAEAAWVHAQRVHGLADVAPEEPLRLHLYGDPEAFDQACRDCGEGTWPGHGGLTSARWGIALVRVGDGLGPERQRRLGLLEEDLWRVAHEAAHLVSLEARRRAPDAAPPPSWWEEAVAEWVAARALAGDQPAAEHPLRSQRQAFAQELLDRGRLPSLEVLLAEEWSLDPFRRYALLGVLADVLAQEHGGLPTRPEALPPREQLEPLLRAQLARLAPRWALGPGYLQRDAAGEWLQVARDDGAAHAWRLPGLTGSHLLLGARLELDDAEREEGAGPLPTPRARLAFARHYHARNGGWDERFLAVELLAGVPPRLVEVRGTELGEQVRELARGREDLGHGPWELRLHVDDGRLELFLDERVVLRSEAPELATPDGQWGVGVTAGGQARWSALGMR